MQVPLVMTVIGKDRTGLVESVAHLVAEHGGNWLESRMCRLGGKFAGILRVHVPSDRRAALEAALSMLTDLTVVVHADESATAAGKPQLASAGRRFDRMNHWTAFLIALLLVITSLNPDEARAATVAERLEQYGPAAHARLSAHFEKQKVAYPPHELVFVGLKKERILEVYARSGTNGVKPIRSYPILAASGVAGPKLREGDRQVPEGIYAVESLNPYSRYHLSLRVNYPNEVDREQARKGKRTNLGGDIMIHGKAVSIDCLALPCADECMPGMRAAGYVKSKKQKVESEECEDKREEAGEPNCGNHKTP